jgi:predicted acetyltransferase
MAAKIIGSKIDATSRPATAADFPFAWKLYSQIIQPIMTPHIRKLRGLGWDTAIEEKRFSEIWDLKKVLIIEIPSGPIGWLSIDGSEMAVRIENIFIEEKYRNRGLGTRLLKWVFTEHKGRPFACTIIKGSKSRKFFERLKFKESAKLGFEVYLVKAA